MENRSFFSLIFFGVLTLTVLSLIVNVFTFMYYVDKIEKMQGLLDTYSTTWKMGFGAIIGLLGARAIADTNEEEHVQKLRKYQT